MRPHRLSPQHVAQLLHFLPQDPVPHDSQSLAYEHAFTVGAIVQDDVVGISPRTSQLPNTTALLCRFLSQLQVDIPFTTLSLYQGFNPSVHRSAQTRPGSLSLLVSLTPDSGPSLWIEDPDGDAPCPHPDLSVRGFLLCSPALYDARRWHSGITHDGLNRRIVMVASTIRSPERVTSDLRSLLNRLGF